MDGQYLHEIIAAPFKNLHRFRDFKWMNPRACCNEAYTPTHIEHFANIITHGIWIIPALFGAIEIIQRSETWAQLISAWVYGTALILIFVVSTSFHCVHYRNQKQLKDVLHRCDRAMIYVFIAATYFPWLMIEDFPGNDTIPKMRYYIWVMAIFGILYQQVFHERYKMLETFFYLVMGVGPSLAIISVNKIDNIRELKTGGFIYIAGIIFFKSDGRIPFAHAIWHVFVSVAAGFHYYAILNYLYPPIYNGESLSALNDLFKLQSEL